MADATCYVCGGIYTSRDIPRHLSSCVESNEPTMAEDAAHISVRPPRDGTYRLELSVTSDAWLDDLDQLLRDVWLECCHHLSSFHTDGSRYERPLREDPHLWGGGIEDMDRPVSVVLPPAAEVSYEYDYGSTTALSLSVRDVYVGTYGVAPPGYDEIYVMARNELPMRECSSCDESATVVCLEHADGEDREGWLCDGCADEHRCGEYMKRPIVNSPRMGVCGFSGAALTDWAPEV